MHPMVSRILHKMVKQGFWHRSLLTILCGIQLLSGNAQATSSASLSLADGLSWIEEQYDCAFLYEPAVLRGKHVQRAWLEEPWSLQGVLDQLTEHTGLQFTKIEDGFWAVQASHPYGRITGWVIDEDGSPLVGTSIFHAASARGTATDSKGYFELWLPAGDVHIQFSFIGFQTRYLDTWLPFGETISWRVSLEKSIDLTEVVVWGGSPVSLSTLAPATAAPQLSATETDRLPVTELGQLLQFAAPSFHTAYQTVSDGTDHIDPAALRGLGPDQMLVLINGKRRHASSMVNVNRTVGRGSVSTDLNAIPLSAVERVEILPDGATAQYGADAIAGVINVVLKDSAASNSMQLLSGITQEGDGLQVGLGGYWNLWQSQKGHLGLSWRLDSRSAVNRSGAYTGTIFGDDRDESPEQREAFFAQTGFSNERVMLVGSAGIRNYGLHLNHEWQLRPATQFYQFGGFNLRTGRSHGFYRFPYQTTKQSGLYPSGFSPEIHPRIGDLSWVIGLRTKIGSWDLDISQNLGGNSVDYLIKNSNNASMGLSSPTSALAGQLRYGQLIWQFSASHRSPDKQTNWRFGASYRNELFRQLTGDEWSWQNYGDTTANGEPREAGMQVFPGYRPANTVHAWRPSVAAHLGLDRIIHDKWRPSIALRWEHWPNTGHHLLAKLGLIYQANDQLQLRAAANSGLRPPSLPQIYFSSQSLQFVPEGEKLVGREIAQLNAEHPLVRQLMSSPLLPERSRNYSVGANWQIGQQMRFSVNAYRIRIKDRIVLGSRLGPSADPYIAHLLEKNQLGEVQFFANAINTLTQGLDLGIDQHWQWRELLFELRVAASFNRTRVQDIRLAKAISGLEELVFNREDHARIERAQPANKVIAYLSVLRGNWALSLQATRFGSVTYWHPLDGHVDDWALNEWTQTYETRDQIFSAKWTTDWSCRWQPNQHWTFGIHGRNIFNVYPDQHRHSANTNDGVFPFSRHVQQFGVWGAHWILNTQLNF